MVRDERSDTGAQLEPPFYCDYSAVIAPLILVEFANK
jgi:hypothetical protein